MEMVTERGFMCCNVVMCVVVVIGGEGGKWKGLQKGFLCAVIYVISAVVMVGETKGNGTVYRKRFYML
jgi:hypothetical protein